MQVINRKPCVNGLFYPGDPEVLTNEIKTYLKEAEGKGSSDNTEFRNPKMLIVPHAGYMYSGKIAAAAYKNLKKGREKTKIVLIGPSHRYPIKKMTLSGADTFETPLGKVTISKELTKIAMSLRFVETIPEAHAQEHSLEVQLPFLQFIFNENLEVLPVLSNENSPAQVAEFFNNLSFVTDIFIISSDLSHYLSYEECEKADSKTCHSIENLDFHPLQYEDACGLSGIGGGIAFAKQNNLKIKCLAKANSGDESGDYDRVVGYAAFASI